MSKPKIIFFDIDGTLIEKKLIVSSLAQMLRKRAQF